MALMPSKGWVQKTELKHGQGQGSSSNSGQKTGSGKSTILKGGGKNGK